MEQQLSQSPNGNRLEYRGGKWQKYVDTGIIFSNWEWVDVSDTDTVYARNDRLCQLKDAVNQFIDQVAAKSPESRSRWCISTATPAMKPAKPSIS